MEAKDSPECYNKDDEKSTANNELLDIFKAFKNGDRDNDNPNVIEVIGIEPLHAPRYKDVMEVIKIYIEK